MMTSVPLYSSAVRIFSLLALGVAILNSLVFFSPEFMAILDVSLFVRGWMVATNVLSGLMVVGIAFMAADAGLSAGPADPAARRRLERLTEWLPAAAVIGACIFLVTPTIGRLAGESGLADNPATLRQVVGLLTLLGWALFGWAAVLRWLRQGPAWSLLILTRGMEALALAALALDLSTAFGGDLSTFGSAGWAVTQAIEAVTQALAVVVCVEVVAQPDPTRLNGWLGQLVRWLTLLAWLAFAFQAGYQVAAILQSPIDSWIGYMAPLTAGVTWLLQLSERMLLTSTIWARELRVTGG